jgi:hypothetical protein
MIRVANNNPHMDGTAQTVTAETYGLRVGEPLPAALGPGELMRALCIRSRGRFALLKRQGEFKRFEFARPIGSKRYSGKKVAEYLQGVR